MSILNQKKRKIIEKMVKKCSYKAPLLDLYSNGANKNRPFFEIPRVHEAITLEFGDIQTCSPMVSTRSRLVFPEIPRGMPAVVTTSSPFLTRPCSMTFS